MTLYKLKDLQWLTIEQAATLLQVSEFKLRTAIKQGSLKCFKDGRVLRISQDNLNEYISNHLTA